MYFLVKIRNILPIIMFRFYTSLNIVCYLPTVIIKTKKIVLFSLSLISSLYFIFVAI